MPMVLLAVAMPIFQWTVSVFAALMHLRIYLSISFFCPLYSAPRAKFWAGILSGINLYSDIDKITFLLSDFDAYMPYSVSLAVVRQPPNGQGCHRKECSRAS